MLTTRLSEPTSRLSEPTTQFLSEPSTRLSEPTTHFLCEDAPHDPPNLRDDDDVEDDQPFLPSSSFSHSTPIPIAYPAGKVTQFVSQLKQCRLPHPSIRVIKWFI